MRNAQDFYATPEGAFKPMLPFIETIGLPVWEPACGDKRLIRWMNEYGIAAAGSDISGDGFQINFLEDMAYRDCIVTNPPFSLAFEFCQHAFDYSEHVFLLLRLNFLASAKRKEWFQAHEPDAIFVLCKRPDFTGGGGDSCDYAWFYWGSYPFKPLNHI